MENTPQTPNVQSAPLEPQVMATLMNYDQCYNFAANLMINQDKNRYEVTTALMNLGMPESEAAIMAESVETEVANAYKAKANKDMLWGAVWCVGGIIVTAATYSAASGGGKYVVAWGAILFGGTRFVRGLMASMKANS
ncbi:hypothetical protein AM493_05410 [Flavobacterium akiainvivens]|uniref:Uncharacterized protein n=1 Tax=Flavobacterium akiainvivens TaxID=1202724 RepID=A0A0M9VHQ3_9FLAO|nr:hypothetical protein [Flavobacterium akiainvivens]KOS05532.1 hypothetical protein AM493_05410 [Flavobacterium akiainvivens]SFQ33760.1 hypothetical protein SAMN05444144_103117 [Flavobacterium akiainvivens]